MDKDSMLAFYDYPAENWRHIRTTNPIESVFATVRLRTAKTKNCGRRITSLTMVFKLMEAAQKKWFRRLRGYNLLADVINGVKFVNGINIQQIKNKMSLDSLYTRFDYSSNNLSSFEGPLYCIHHNTIIWRIREYIICLFDVFYEKYELIMCDIRCMIHNHICRYLLGD